MSAGTIGQVLAALICPYLNWVIPFYLFGTFGFIWLAIWLTVYTDVQPIADDQLPLIYNKDGDKPVHWTRLLCHWSLWAIYIAHFAMNWSNYIVMQWLPTYLSRSLGANKESFSLTAVPYVLNSFAGVGKRTHYL